MCVCVCVCVCVRACVCVCVPINNIFENMRIHFAGKVKGLKTHFSIINTIRLQSRFCVSSSVV